VLGEGSGGFGYSYTLKREVENLDVRDAHSLELETLAELGIPGLLLLVAALGGAFAGVLRARRSGPAAAALAAAVLGSGAYWLIHASVDWFWSYPAVTGAMLALLGSACAPALATSAERASRAWRWLAIAGAAVLALSAVPPFLAERYVNQAYAGWRDDLQQAYDDLDAAASLNRLTDAPLLAEGAIAREVGDRERALAAFRAAEAKRPEEWATHHLLAGLLARSDPPAAREQIRLALELNPLGARSRALAEQLGVEPGPVPGG
jgi:tetratricopeptide (TPR) repeat protein